MTNHSIMTNQPTQLLRQWMQAHGAEAVYVVINDPHGSEYTAAHWQYLRYLTGFTGSAAMAVVTQTEALLWTDSRYWLQAADELSMQGYTLMRAGAPGVPGPFVWCIQHGFKRISVPGELVLFYDENAAHLNGLDIEAIDTTSLFAEVWPERPALPAEPISVQPLKWAGETAQSKLKRLADYLKKHGVKEHFLVCDLADIAWLLNLRGRDVACNPVFVAWLVMDVRSGHSTLYTHGETLTDEAREQLRACDVELQPYEAIHAWEGLATCSFPIDEAPLMFREAYRGPGLSLRFVVNPIERWRAAKNEAEQAGFREAMERDGVALVQFLRWMDRMRQAGTLPTEMGLDHCLTKLRAAQPGYDQLSFDTIAGYGPHGAIVHYEADPETDVKLQPRGLLLLDSGAQYDCGTTDITRTLALGPLTDEERRVYTLVFKGHLALQRQQFPTGSIGMQLDLAARQYMWNEGYNFGHGTGHGVGSHLCVHEGPQQIRDEMRSCTQVVLTAGMTITDEPGIYVEGRFGVRIENTLLVVEGDKTPFGTFLRFEPLTLCPYDLTAVDRSMLTETEVRQINDYHAMVRERLMPRLTDEADREWLTAHTQPIA